MRAAAGLLTQALELGLVGATDVLDDEVRLVPVPRSNLLHRLDVGGRPVAFVKQQGQAGATDGTATVAQETQALRLLGGGPVPDLLHADDGCVWTAALEGIPLYAALPAAPGPVAAALGSALATLHGTAVDPWPEPPRATLPWPVTDATPASIDRVPADSAAAALLAQVRDGADARRLAGAGRRWRTGHWVHGDLSGANALVDRVGGRARVSFLDLEDAGVGDPSWDVVCALRCLDDALVPGAAEAAREAFWGAYRDGGGSGEEDPALRLAHDAMADVRAALTELSAAGAEARAGAGAVGR